MEWLSKHFSDDSVMYREIVLKSLSTVEELEPFLRKVDNLDDERKHTSAVRPNYRRDREYRRER